MTDQAGLPRAGTPGVVITLRVGGTVTVASTAATEQEQRVLEVWLARTPGAREVLAAAERLAQQRRRQ